MSAQRSLFDPTIEQRFFDFHRENPQVYTILVSLARQAKAAGKKRIGIKALFERARWDLWLQTRGDDFRLNNSYSSRYSRMIEDLEPDLRGLFEKRTLRAA
jgi:hypothetical protein